MGWIAAHPTLAAALCLGGLLVLLNFLACRHAWAMTHFIPVGGWRRRPEALTRAEKARALVLGIQLCRPALKDTPESYGLVSETHRFRGACCDLEAWYLPHPSPLGTVLLFHGYNACKAKLLPEARALHELGYACFLVDFPGCGGSAGNVTTIGYREAVDVAEAVAYVRRTWNEPSVTLFGQSMGAAAVLRALGCLKVEAEAAVLECPFDRLLTTIRARFAALGVPSFPAAHLMMLWGCLQLGYNGFAHNPVTYARSVYCPVLVMHGQDDRRVGTGEVRAVYEALAGPKDLHFFEGLGHESYAAPRAQEWKECVGAFLHARALAQ